MSISAISRRYAKALVQMGAEQKMVERYGEELSALEGLLKKESALRMILESPSFPLEKKTAILADLMGSMQVSDGMKNFLGLLLSKDRLRYFSQIEDDYRRFADELSGVVRARIDAAADLDATQQKAIKEGLEKQTGKKVELTVALDPSLIGGIKAEIGGRVFDGSLKTQLKRIEDSLKKG